MLRVGRILKDFADAGSVNSMLAPWAFVDDHAFITKAGHVGLAYRLEGVDFECLDTAQRRDVVHRFEGALRLLDESCRLYQYLIKRCIKPVTDGPCENALAHEAISRRLRHLNGRRSELYDIDLYLVLLYEWSPTVAGEGPVWSRPLARLRQRMSTGATLALLEEQVVKALGTLYHRAASLEIHLADSVQPTRLGKRDAFKFLRRLVNYTDSKADGAGLRYDTHLDYFLADCSLECHRRHLDVDSAHVKVLTLKEPPSATYPHILEGLYTVPGEYIACLEWRRLPADRVRKDIHSRRRHFFNQRVSLVNYVAPDTRPDEMLVDETASGIVRQLGEALTDVEVHGHFFGECSLTLVLQCSAFDGLEQQVAEAIKVMATHDGTFAEESYNLLNAWLAIVPGNGAHNLRRLAVLETNCADLSFLFTLDRGQPYSPQLGREALAVLETEHNTPFHWSIHVQDVGHTLVLGATGSGKSFLLNFLVTHAQKYNPPTLIFDLGHSYRKLATLLGGSYLALGLSHPETQINPFSLAPTPDNLHFLHAFVRVLLEGDGASRLGALEDRELYEAIENLYVLDTSQRRLFTLANLLPRALSARLTKWTQGGRYADLFDHSEDTLELQRFQVFDFEEMRAYPALLEPLLFYVLHRATADINDPDQARTLKLCVMDEAWRFIQHPTLRSYVEEALKTWRKRNAAMVLASQSVDDFASADLLRTVVESCPTKLLLANPSLDRSRYAELFRLNETELSLLGDLVPRRQFLLKRPSVAKVLNLSVDPHSYWLYTNTPIDNDRVNAVFREFGFADGLERLAASA